LEALEALVLERSDPTSQNYQQWLTHDEVLSMVTNPISYQRVLHWCNENKLNVTFATNGKEYLRITSTVDHLERVLHVRFYHFEEYFEGERRSEQRQSYLRAEKFTIPEELAPHVEAIFNIVDAPSIIAMDRSLDAKREKRTGTSSFIDDTTTSIGTHRIQSNRHLRRESSSVKSSTKSASISNSYVGTEDQGSPDKNPVNLALLNKLYEVENNLGDQRASQAIIQAYNGYFSPNDLRIFQNTYGAPIQPITKIIGGHASNRCSEKNDNAGTRTRCYGTLHTAHTQELSFNLTCALKGIYPFKMLLSSVMIRSLSLQTK
jgi:subtilase family serine protease